MKIEMLKKEKLNDFVEYCKKHRYEIDDSNLSDEDLKEFEPSDENPTYIVTEADEIVAAASLIIDDYNRRGKKGRFRIFHSELEDSSCYKMLLEAILKHTQGLEKIVLFIPFVNEKLKNYIEELKFNVERYSFLLVRAISDIPEINLPEGYEIRKFRLGIDETTWCEVRNPSFATLKGSETPMTPEMIAKMMSEEGSLDGGAMILYHGEKPVGVVLGGEDDYEGSPIMNIGPLAIIPEYQGRGLGRCLLRAALHFAKRHSFERTILCVNAENERAKALYLQEGFKQVEGVTCYKYDLI